jgi:hypothetical protein
MNRLTRPSGIPVVDCPTEFGDDDLFEEKIVDKAWEERFPGFEDGDDRLRVVGSPGVVYY